MPPMDAFFTSKVKLRETKRPNPWWQKLDGRCDELENGKLPNHWKWPNAENRHGRDKSRAGDDILELAAFEEK